MDLKQRWNARKSFKKPHSASVQCLIDMVGQDGDAAGMAEDPRLNAMVNEAESWQPQSHDNQVKTLELI